MADVPGKPTAKSSSAGLNKEIAAGPLQWSDKCFLCNREIGESDPRGFYTGTAAMMLCHRGCLNIMETHGGQPQDYHRAVEDKQATLRYNQAGPAPGGGPAWLDFPDLLALQAYTKLRGDIPATVKVTVAGKIVQG